LYINTNLLSKLQIKLFVYRYKFINNFFMDFLNKFSKITFYKKLIKNILKL